MSRLDPWRNGLDAPKGEDADRILQANFDEQAKFNDKIGLYLVGSVKPTATASTTSTSYVDLKGLKLSVNTSGGLVVVVAPVVATTGQNTMTLGLFIDDSEKATAVCGTSGAIFDYSTVTLFWTGTLPEGQHVFNVKYASSAGTIEAAATSAMYVLEFLKG